MLFNFHPLGSALLFLLAFAPNISLALSGPGMIAKSSASSEEESQIIKGRLSKIENCQNGPNHNLFAEAEKSLARVTMGVYFPDGSYFASSHGSGLVVSKEGHIVTNRHVIGEKVSRNEFLTAIFKQMMQRMKDVQQMDPGSMTLELAEETQNLEPQLFSMLKPEALEEGLRRARVANENNIRMAEEKYQKALAEYKKKKSEDPEAELKEPEKKPPLLIDIPHFEKNGVNVDNFLALINYITAPQSEGVNIYSDKPEIAGRVFVGGYTYKTKRITESNTYDLALIKVVDALPDFEFDFMTFGDERELMIPPVKDERGEVIGVSGEELATLGFPYQVKIPSLSFSTVSNRNKEGSSPSGAPARYMIINDGALNPGNSGGPAFICAKKWKSDEPGKLTPIGINTAIVAPKGSPTGIAMSIPGSLIGKFVDQGIKYATFRAISGLGIKMKVRKGTNQVFEEIQIEKLLERAQPADELAFLEGGTIPTIAEEIGLEEGDLLLRYNGFELDGNRKLLAALVRETTTDEELEMVVERRGEIVKLSLVNP